MIKQQNGKFRLGIYLEFNDRAPIAEHESSNPTSYEVVQPDSKGEFLAGIKDLEVDLLGIMNEIAQDTKTAEGVTENLDREQKRIETKENGVNKLDNFIDGTISKSEIIGFFTMCKNSERIQQLVDFVGKTAEKIGGRVQEATDKVWEKTKDVANKTFEAAKQEFAKLQQERAVEKAKKEAVKRLTISSMTRQEKSNMEKINANSSAFSQAHTDHQTAVAEAGEPWGWGKSALNIFNGKLADQWSKEKIAKQTQKILNKESGKISKESNNMVNAAEGVWRDVSECLKLGVSLSEIDKTEKRQMLTNLAKIAQTALEVLSNEQKQGVDSESKISGLSPDMLNRILDMDFAATHGIQDLSIANAQRLGLEPQATENPQNTQDQSQNQNQADANNAEPVKANKIPLPKIPNLPAHLDAPINSAAQVMDNMAAGDRFTIMQGQTELTFEKTPEGKFNAIGDPEEVKKYQNLTLTQFTDAMAKEQLSPAVVLQPRQSPFDTQDTTSQTQQDNATNPFEANAQGKDDGNGESTNANPEPDQSPSPEATNETKQALTTEQQGQIDQVARQLNRPNLKQGDKLEVKVTGSDGKELVYTLTKTTGMFNFLVSSKDDKDVIPMQNTTQFAKSLTKDIQNGAKVEVLVNPDQAQENKDRVSTNLLVVDEKVLAKMPTGKQFRLLPVDPKYAKPTMFTKTPDGKFAYKANGLDGIAEARVIMSGIQGGDFLEAVEVPEGNELTFSIDSEKTGESNTVNIEPNLEKESIEIAKLSQVSPEQKATLSYKYPSGEIKSVKIEYSKEGELLLSDGKTTVAVSLEEIQKRFQPQGEDITVELFRAYTPDESRNEEVADLSADLVSNMKPGQEFTLISKDPNLANVTFTKNDGGNFVFDYFGVERIMDQNQLTAYSKKSFTREVIIPKNGGTKFQYDFKPAVTA